VVLATKVYWPVDATDPNGRGVSRRHIVEQCELSLRRLRTDHVDLYYLHRLDPDVPVDEPLRALDDLVRAGKVRYIGASTTAAWQFVEALWVSKELHLNRFVAETPPYNILDRRIERELLPMAETFGIAVNVWAPIAGGLLSGLYRRDEPVPADSRYADPRIATAYSHRLNAGVFDVLDAIEPVAEARECSLAQLALAWVMQQTSVTTAVSGPEKLSDLVENIRAAELSLNVDELKRIDEAAPPGGMISAFYEPDANQFRAHAHRV
jgi:aryl-alcohol dehydrogenase-like predicted oxidoreductase